MIQVQFPSHKFMQPLVGIGGMKFLIGEPRPKQLSRLRFQRKVGIERRSTSWTGRNLGVGVQHVTADAEKAAQAG